jgi:hypothetical protein
MDGEILGRHKTAYLKSGAKEQDNHEDSLVRETNGVVNVQMVEAVSLHSHLVHCVLRPLFTISLYNHTSVEKTSNNLPARYNLANGP